MLSLSEFKKALGPVADQLSEDEITKLRDLQYRLADVIFDRWLREQSGHDDQIGSNDDADPCESGILPASMTSVKTASRCAE